MGWNELSDPDMRIANFEFSCDVYREGVYLVYPPNALISGPSRSKEAQSGNTAGSGPNHCEEGEGELNCFEKHFLRLFFFYLHNYFRYTYIYFSQ